MRRLSISDKYNETRLYIFNLVMDTRFLSDNEQSFAGYFPGPNQ